VNELIPLADLAAQHASIRNELIATLEEAAGRTDFILGEAVGEFERAFADFSGTSYCIGVANGTDALELILRALGIGPGDDVVLPTNTFIATALAVARAGARPVLVDCDETALLIDPEEAASRLEDGARAVIPVHLYGQMAPVEQLSKSCADAGATLIEDAAQAQGARRNGQGPASFGAAAGVSFYPAKNLGALGDAGAVLTNDEGIAQKIRALRNYGSEKKYEHPLVGFNSRLDTLQAAVLTVKLRHLRSWNDKRREAARRYDELLVDLPVVRTPHMVAGNDHVWHLYVVRLPERDRVLRALNDAGIGAAIHYPMPIHLQTAFANLGHAKGDFPVAERASGEMISLPIYPEITAGQQERVVETLARALGA
jgi:dTDP-4-amino-4,6-dideoxygalactose transaminase